MARSRSNSGSYRRSDGPGGPGSWISSRGDFFSWSLPVFRAFGISVRVHLLFVLYIASQIIWSLARDTMGFNYTLITMSVLWVSVLLHEFGHCFACRAVGGEADRILMWPLGGLAFCIPPRRWLPSFITTAGGPLVNVVIALLSAGVLLLMGKTFDALIFNPFNPGLAIIHANPANHWQLGVWFTYYVNLVLLAFNVLLPMFPMDCGRMVQELLWSRIGYRRSMTVAVNLGLAAAVIVGMVGIVGGESMLVGIAIFCGFTCWSERQNLRFIDPEPEYDAGGPFGGPPPGADDLPARTAAAKTRRAEEEKHFSEVDRILIKIKDHGMGSLTRAERATLQKETERKRQQ